MESVRPVYEFKGFEEIDEVIIPPRRDKRGRRFSFVCFYNVEDARLLATKMDNVMLDGRKIYANVPRFQRKVINGEGSDIKRQEIKLLVSTLLQGGQKLGPESCGTRIIEALLR